MKAETKLDRAIKALAEALFDDVLDEAQWVNKEERGIGEPDAVKTKKDLMYWIADRAEQVGELVENEAYRMLRATPMSEVRKRIKPK